MISLLILTGALLNQTPSSTLSKPDCVMGIFNSGHNNALVEHNIVDEHLSYSISSLTKEIDAELQSQLALLSNAEITLDVNKNSLDYITISNNY